MSEEQKPLGERIRNLIEPALDDPRREQVQHDLVNAAFQSIADQLEMRLERTFTNIFNQASAVEKRSPDMKNVFIVQQLTEVNPQTGEAKFSPVVRLAVPVATAYLELSPLDIKEMPGYIALHEKARELDVSLRLVNMTAEDGKSPSPYPQQAILVIDASKSYDAGALENATLYPNLPPKPVKFNPKAGDQFKFGT